MRAAGSTALVTGASSAIGREFAGQLAGRCAHLIIVGRREEPLEALAAQLAGTVTVEAVACDLATVEGQVRIAELLRRRAPVTLVVNGASVESRGPFAAGDVTADLAMMQLHNASAVYLCRVALPFMLEAGGGAIINLISAGAFGPGSGAAAHGASMAFLLSFSRSLAAELRGSGVVVQALCPGIASGEGAPGPGRRRQDGVCDPRAARAQAAAVVGESLERLQRGDEVVISDAGSRRLAAEALRALAASIDEEPT